MLRIREISLLLLVACAAFLPLHAGWSEAYGPSRENFVPFAVSASATTVGTVTSIILLKKIYKGLQVEMASIKQKLAAEPNNPELKAAYSRLVRRLITCGIALVASLGVTIWGGKVLWKHVQKNELIRHKEVIRREAQGADVALAEAWQSQGNDEALKAIVEQYRQKRSEKVGAAANERELRAAAAMKRAGHSRKHLQPAPADSGREQAAPHIERALKAEYDQKIMDHLGTHGDSRMKALARARKLDEVEKEQNLYERVYKPHYSFWQRAKTSLWGSKLPEKEIIVEGHQITLPRDAEALLER